MYPAGRLLRFAELQAEHLRRRHGRRRTSRRLNRYSQPRFDGAVDGSSETLAAEILFLPRGAINQGLSIELLAHQILIDAAHRGAARW